MVDRNRQSGTVRREERTEVRIPWKLLFYWTGFVGFGVFMAVPGTVAPTGYFTNVLMIAGAVWLVGIVFVFLLDRALDRINQTQRGRRVILLATIGIIGVVLFRLIMQDQGGTFYRPAPDVTTTQQVTVGVKQTETVQATQQVTKQINCTRVNQGDAPRMECILTNEGAEPISKSFPCVADGNQYRCPYPNAADF